MRTRTKKRCSAFTLVEIIVVLLLAAAVLTAVLGIYQQVRAGGLTILGQMEETRLQTEILQKIAEDIDRMAAPGFDTKINFTNKRDNGYISSQVFLENSYYGKGDKKDRYEQIVWRSVYDPFEDALILYRMHRGLIQEDPLILPDSDEPPFVPVAVGLTHFRVRAQQGENILNAWQADSLPKAARVEISFAPFEELPDGTVGIPEDQIFGRTIAIDRTRVIPFQFIKKTFELPEEDPNDLLEDDELTDEENDLEGDTEIPDTETDRESDDDETS